MQAEKKPIYTSIAAAVLVILVAFAIFGHWGGDKKESKGPEGNATSTTQQAGTLEMEIITLASTTELLDIRAEYPRFPDAPLLNKKIDAYVAESIDEFRKNAIANDQARKDTLAPGETPTKVTYTFDLSWEHAQLNERTVSIMLHVYAFDGGANGRQVLSSFNWDMKEQREIPLASLFPGDNAYLQRISEYTRQVLSGTLGENSNAEFLSDGTQPLAANFQWFTFTDQALTIFFPKYQVAPGAAGEQQVTMPRNVEGLF